MHTMTPSVLCPGTQAAATHTASAKMTGMTIWSQDGFLRAWNFASTAHAGHLAKGTDEPESYLRHLGPVAAEVMAAIAARDDVADPDLAVQCAILHDVVEDTRVSIAQIEAEFGAEVAAGVAALTRDEAAGDRTAQILDSLERIRARPREVWMVKLADRITNLQPPPLEWDEAEVAAYRRQALEIHDALAEACPILGPRLAAKIEAYPGG